jgi:hypothetical protein
MVALAVPPGKWTGPDLLPRRFNPGEVCGFVRDVVPPIPQKEWPALLANPDRVRMTRMVKWIFDQDNEGSCASESSAGDLAIIREWMGLPFVRFNPWFNYFHVKMRGGGSSLDDNLRFGREFGYCPEEIWPRSKGVRKPSQEAYDVAKEYCGDEFDELQSTTEAGSLLLRGLPFAFGWEGHSCVAVEQIDMEWFWYLNSWDATWGERPYPECPFKGFGRLRFRDIEWRYGAYAFRTGLDLAA